MAVVRGHLWAAEMGWEMDQTQAVVSVQVCTGLVQVQMYIENQLVTHICRLLEEPLMVIGLFNALFINY